MDKDQRIKELEEQNAALSRHLYLILSTLEKTLIEIGKIKEDDETTSR